MPVQAVHIFEFIIQLWTTERPLQVCVVVSHIPCRLQVTEVMVVTHSLKQTRFVLNPGEVNFTRVSGVHGVSELCEYMV